MPTAPSARKCKACAHATPIEVLREQQRRRERRGARRPGRAVAHNLVEDVPHVSPRCPLAEIPHGLVEFVLVYAARFVRVERVEQEAQVLQHLLGD